MNTRSISCRALLLSLMLPCASLAQDGEWLVAPYIWAADVSWDINQRGGGSVAFSDIVDKIDGAGLIRVEYAREKFGVSFDYVGMSLSDTTSISTPGPLPVSVGIQADIDLEVFEGALFYRPSAVDSGVHFLAGLRNTDVDSALIISTANAPPQLVDTGKGFTDFFVGARYLHRFNPSWDLSVRGDYGYGGSEGALNLIANVGWRMSDTFGLSFAYRHYQFELDQTVENEAVTNDFAFSGPALGFLFRF